MMQTAREYYDAKNAKRRLPEYRAKDREIYANNPEVAEANRKQCREYYKRNKEKIAARMKEYNQRPEVQARLKEQRKEWYIKKGKENGTKKCKDLELRYIRELLKKDGELKGVAIPLELLEAKRLQVLIRREVLENVPPRIRQKGYKEKSEARNPFSRKEYYEKNKERLAELGKQWRIKNKERVNAKRRLWVEANKEKRKEQARAIYHTNTEKAREKNKKYREANRKKMLAKSKADYHANKEAISIKRKNVTPEQRAHINALARAAVARRKLKLNQEGVAQ